MGNRKDRRAAAAKGIDNDVVLLCNVEQGVSDKRDRLDGRMQLKSPLAALAREAIGTGVIPDVGAIAPERPSWTLLRCCSLPLRNTKMSSCLER
jgi:hypothetical protein